MITKAIVKDADIVFDTLGKNYTHLASCQNRCGIVVSVVGPLDEVSAKMFGMADYKLQKNWLHKAVKKLLRYKFMHREWLLLLQ
jgi:hypothetical protein